MLARHFLRPALYTVAFFVLAAITANAQIPAAETLNSIPPLPPAGDAALGYSRTNDLIWLVSTAIGLVFPALILFTGTSAKIRDLSQRIGKLWLPTLAIYLAIYLALAWIVNLPLNWFDNFYVEHAYGLSNQSLGRWLRNSAIMIVLGLILFTVAFGLLYRFINWSPKRWWLWGAVTFVPVTLLLSIIQPIYIEPLFNRFEPVSDAAIESEIRALADRAGIGDADILEMNASADTESINAAVRGFLGTKRIVFYDTMMEKLDRDAVLFVMGHEIGHYVLNHRIQRILIGSVLVLAALWTLFRLSDKLITSFERRFGFSKLHDIASVPLFLVYIQLLSLVFLPVYAAFVRHTEHEADRFALEMTQDNVACAKVMIAGIEERLSSPRPGLMYRVWQASHPTIGDRYDFCVAYRPWETGADSKYTEHFSL